MKLAVGLVASLFAASAANAAVYDFTGFTITFDGPDWSENSTDGWSSQLDNFSYNWATGEYSSTPKGITQSQGQASFSKSALPTLEASGVGDNQSYTSSFFFAIQAKDGQQLSNANFSSYETGSHRQFKGGTVLGNGIITTAATEGIESQPWHAYWGGNDVSTPNLKSGNWVQYGSHHPKGNQADTSYEYFYDDDGSWNGYKYTYSLNDSYSPLTSLSGTGSLTFDLSTNGAKQIAFAEPTDGSIFLSATAVQVSPVPQPETYAMMLGGLAALGFAARRKSKRKRLSWHKPHQKFCFEFLPASARAFSFALVY